MKFEEAETKLNEIAGNRYHSLRFKKSIFSYGETRIDTECAIYIEGEDWFSGPTWADAFRARKIALNPPVEETPEVDG